MLRHNPTFPSLRFALLAAIALLLGGCATLFTGTADTLTFDANVKGVRLTIDGEYQGELPLTVTVSRNFVGGRLFLVKFEKAGYATQEFTLHREFNPVAILDVTSLPVSGGVDVLTGALMKFSPRDYHVQMLRSGATPSSVEFRRSLRVFAFALGSYRAIQKELARGGGAQLGVLAAAVAGDDPEGAARIIEESLRCTPILLGADSAHAFVERFRGMLAASPALRKYAI